MKMKLFSAILCLFGFSCLIFARGGKGDTGGNNHGEGAEIQSMSSFLKVLPLGGQSDNVSGQVYLVVSDADGKDVLVKKLDQAAYSAIEANLSLLPIGAYTVAIYNSDGTLIDSFVR